MNFFSSLSSRHNHGIPVQNILLVILFFFCSVQTVNAAEKSCWGDPCKWTDKTNDECACYYHLGTGWDTWTCGNGRGLKYIDLNYKGNEFVRKIWCRGCTSAQSIKIEDKQNVCRCKIGYYGASAWDATCTPCQAGKYGHAIGQVECQLCDEKTTSAVGSGTCTWCPAGTYSDENRICQLCSVGKSSGEYSSSCSTCGVGKYNDVAGGACKDCAAGTYNNGEGMGFCFNCAAGKYSTTTGATQESNCLQCAAGKYSSAEGSSSCTPCAAGTYSITPGAAGSSQCQPCGLGTFSQAGSTSCGECGIGYQTTGSSCTQCPAGYFKATTGAGYCTECGLEYYSNPGASQCSTCVFPQGAFVVESSEPSMPSFTEVGWMSTSCRSCPEGRYANGNRGSGAYACRTCSDGKYLENIGAAVSWELYVESSWPFSSSYIKKYPCLICKSCVGGTTINCVPTSIHEGICNVCGLGQRVIGDRLCTLCGEGTYQTLATLSLHPQECEPCPAFVRGPELHILSTSPVGSSIIGACVCNSAK
jgi:hypothetical protein